MMKKIIYLIFAILFTVAFPFIILTISYNTQNLYSGSWQGVYEFLLLIVGIFGTSGFVMTIALNIENILK